MILVSERYKEKLFCNSFLCVIESWFLRCTLLIVGYFFLRSNMKKKECSMQCDYLNKCCVSGAPFLENSAKPSKVEKTEKSKNSAKSTGQIISEGHFGVLNFSIKQQNCLNDFFPSLYYGSNRKIKAF